VDPGFHALLKGAALLATAALVLDARIELRPLNGRPMPGAAQQELRILAGGHLYGSPDSTAVPASTLRAAIPRLSRQGADLFLSLGDLFRTDARESTELTRSVLAELPFPVLHAIGNHEASWRDRYRAEFGRITGVVDLGLAWLVLVDTERQPWRISGRTLSRIRHVLETAPRKVEFVIIGGHKLVFADLPGYEAVLARVNARDGWPGRTGFAEEVLPLLREHARSRTIIWLAGDIGLPHSHPLFHDRHESGVHFAAAGLGDAPHDALWEIRLCRGEPPAFSVVPLGASAPRDAASASLAAWRARSR
jgi:hypothetical protein